MSLDASKDIIVLARHGKPALSRKVRLTAQQYRDWWNRYDEGGLAQPQKSKKKTITIARQADIVLSSTLRRAIETAQMAVGEKPDKSLAVFNEAPLPPPPLGPLKFRPKTWGVLSRICWFFGMNGGMEAVTSSRIRAKEAASLLETEAAGGKLVFVAAHGWFNRMIGTQLRLKGWRRTENHGDLHWAYRRYERASNAQDI